MSAPECPRPSYEFGPYRLETVSRTLLRDGKRVPLPSRALDALIALICNRGQVMDRRTLMRVVWPDTVVEDNNLTQCVMAIRKALGDQYIVTVPGRGYCFTEPVRVLVSPPGKWGRIPRRAVLAAGLLTAAALLAGAARLWSDRSGPQPILMPLTGAPREARPAFSPDGLRVAYEWAPEGEDRQSLYVKLIGAGEPTRLTHGKFAASPAWSPDGRYIAYVGVPPGIYLIPAVGGVERRITETHELGVGGRSIDWFPDGKRLAIKDRDPATGLPSIFEVFIESGKRRQITRGVSDGGDLGPAVSPDGKTLGLVRVLGLGGHGVYLVPTAGGEPRRLTRLEERANSLAWTPDGREIVYSASPTGLNSLWRVPVAGGVPRLMSIAGYSAMGPAIAPVGDRLAFTQRKETSSLWQIELDGGGSPRQIAESTRSQSNPQFSPDGSRLAFNSNRSGASEVWTSDAAGRNLARVTFMGARGGTVGSPRWSPDGAELTFAGGPAGTADILVSSVHGGVPHPVVSDPAEDMLPRYSRDGHWIYFTSNRTGRFQIWKAPRSGGVAVQVTREGGVASFEDPAGQHVYYTNPSKPGIWRIPTAGGAETPVVENPGGWQPGEWRSFATLWTVTDTGILFYFDRLSTDRPESWVLKRFDPSTSATTTLLHLTNVPASLTISADGRTCVYAQADGEIVTIMVVENFR